MEQNSSTRFSSALIISLVIHGLVVCLAIAAYLSGARIVLPKATANAGGDSGPLKIPFFKLLPAGDTRAELIKAIQSPGMAKPVVIREMPRQKATFSFEGKNAVETNSGTASTSVLDSVSRGINTSASSGSGGGGAGNGKSKYAPIYRPDPVYPPAALRANIEGEVKVLLTIGVDGKVKDYQILSVTGHPDFARETNKVVPFWQFPPLSNYGVNHPVQDIHWIQFRIVYDEEEE